MTIDILPRKRSKDWVGVVARWSTGINEFYKAQSENGCSLGIQEIYDWTLEDLIVVDTYDIQIADYGPTLSPYVSATLYAIKGYVPILKIHILNLTPLRYLTSEEALLHPYPLVKRLADNPRSL